MTVVGIVIKIYKTTKKKNFKNRAVTSTRRLSHDNCINSFTPKVSFFLLSLVLNQLMIPYLIFLLIFIFFLLNIELVLLGEILFWSLEGVKGLMTFIDNTITIVQLDQQGNLRGT